MAVRHYTLKVTVYEGDVSDEPESISEKEISELASELSPHQMKKLLKQQVRHSSLCRAVQDGFLLSDLPDLWLLLVKLIAETQASILLSDLPDLVVTSQINSRDPGKYLPELPNFMHYYTWCHAHVVRARHARCPRMSSACRLHIICSSSPHHLCVICACAYVVRTRTHHPHIIYTSSALLPMVTGGLNYLLL